MQTDESYGQLKHRDFLNLNLCTLWEMAKQWHRKAESKQMEKYVRHAILISHQIDLKPKIDY